MCGRYTLSTPTDLLSDLYELETEITTTPRFNIAPTQEAPVIRISPETGKRRLDLLRWGLVPFWAKDSTIGNRMINARSETAAEKPAYRVSLRKRRCLVPADGFYEWQATGGPKQPFFFHRKDGYPFAMAGLWDRWEKGEDGPLETFTILTTVPNEIVAPIHERMPVILHPEQYETWLQGSPSVQSLQEFLTPYPADAMKLYQVSSEVNSPKNDQATCLLPE